VETAQRQAEDIVADANAKADRIRSESERELAALTNRRDSINAQLTNVREMLATLTGAAVAAAGSPADDEPISRGVPAQQSR
jgi:vacuolar-type H+-ATPase subunit H